MANHSSPDHVQFDVGHAAPKVLPRLNHCAVIASFPKGSRALLAPVVPLGELTFDLVHPPADQLAVFGPHQNMSVVGGQAITQDFDGKTFEALQDHLAVTIAIQGKF